MQFGTINKHILFGGGDLLIKIALFLKASREKIKKVLQYRAIYTPDGLKKQ